MSLRAVFARLILGGLCIAQLAALAALLALVLGQPDAPDIHIIVQRLTDGILPAAILAAAACALSPGAMAAMALWRLRSAGLASGLLAAPLLIPVVLFHFGDDTQGRLGTLLSHASLGLALGAICGMACLAPLEIGVLRAAAMCGVSPWGALRRVVLPVMLPGLVAAVLLAITVPILASIFRQALNLPELLILPIPHVVMIAGAGLAVLLCAIAAAAVTLLRRL
jgi:ABC-type spermidine/putrescine transport system permease subunit II